MRLANWLLPVCMYTYGMFSVSRSTAASGTISAFGITPARTSAVTYMSFFSRSPGIGGLDARLQSPRGWIESRRDILNLAAHNAGVRFIVDGYFIADVHVGDVVLVDVDEHPHRAHIRKREALRSAGLQQLPRRAEPLHHFSRQGRQQRHFRRGRAGYQVFRIRYSQDPDGLFAGLQVGLCLRAGRFGLLEIGLCDGLVRVRGPARACKILSAS